MLGSMGGMGGMSGFNGARMVLKPFLSLAPKARRGKREAKRPHGPPSGTPPSGSPPSGPPPSGGPGANGNGSGDSTNAGQATGAK